MERLPWVREDISEVDWLRQKLNEEVKEGNSLSRQLAEMGNENAELRARNSALVEGIRRLAAGWKAELPYQEWPSVNSRLQHCINQLEALVPPDPATEPRA